MSFFGFDPRGPQDRGHPAQAPGFGSAPDPFASISQNQGLGQEDDDAIDFDDTYDGLGDQLQEADDDFNDDTFGGGGATTKSIGKDFDFYGSTSKVTDAINEEALRFNRQQPPSNPPVASSSPPKHASKTFRTGYEAYKNPGYIPEMQVDASLWGTGPQKFAKDYGSKQSSREVGPSQQRSSSGVPTKKMMSLEEVEAAMRSQPKRPSPGPEPQQLAQASGPFVMPQTKQQAPQPARPQQAQMPYPQQMPPTQHETGRAVRPGDLAQAPISIQQRPQPGHHMPRATQVSNNELPTRSSPAAQAPQVAPAPPQILQRGHNTPQQAPETQASPQPRQILQNPNRQSAQLAPRLPEQPLSMQKQQRAPPPGQNGAQVPVPIIYHPSQIMHLSDEERNAYLVEEAKRAKRNHKIFLLSKGNGLMTPQDKNFITRIQLQQLMTATGNVNEQDPDTSLSEDFYYQVYNQIENRPRQNPQQPLSNFAQTYLFRTGGRQGGMGKRQRGGDSHVQRMEQQVQRAVEAAKAKPKNKQLVIEGSLGKISFSNAKTPKPLLNIKRHDSSNVTTQQSSKKAQAVLSTTDRKAILKNIEAVYSTLMRMEDHDRRLPAPPTEDSELAAVQQVMEWQQAFQELNQKLWMDLKVTEPILPDSAILHPFIAFLSYPKGKKAVPRIFNHIDENQRLTILTMIIVHLDILDVIRQAQPGAQPSPMSREQVDLFLQAVMPSLFSYVTEAPLNIVIGLLGLVTERVNLSAVARTRVGLEVLTMLLSRAAIVKATEATDDQTWDQWLGIYNRFFDLLEPLLGEVFPASVNAGQDQYVWQFLAATGSGANPEQQQRLVLAVKDRVMETLQQSKTLPPEMALQRRGNVNLFMQAIGLDVDLLDG
ncbi:hypothetical protein HO173_012444 [Letharia columbiana]|uniref:mRNA decay factor PAT1 domain-containing protein n=1 Tax=Letharia columbiana TaxID=112416 RepID=A0A8H6CNR3_9LECA|nr:uncharacterized protein HO173_012444 [Letharia columbiana]KAF6226614.1 hypothetical protein HO173_012444 [Letharia columbiana]